ncbi:MAG TPA: type 4a pilus biogenesis protein PilO [Gammaproteobacteria bacterium]|nr:type 4a pilus biogenesis protein PilO [Gammaproteobacteria bacterium]
MNKFKRILIRWHYLLIMFVCASVVVFVYLQDILPLRRELISGREQREQLRQQLQKLYYQETSLEEKMAKLPETKIMLNEWQKKFIKYSDSDKLLKEIIAVSKRDHLQIKSLNSSALGRENDYLKQSFKIVLEGDYQQVAHFIGQLGNLPWTVVIGSFSLSRLLSDAGQLFSGELEFSVYYLNR